MDNSLMDSLKKLAVRGCLETTEQIGEMTVSYRTLRHDEEVDVFRASNNQPFALKCEQLTRAITSIDGQKIGDSAEERVTLRKLLGDLPFSYINALYAPYVKLAESVPPLTAENISSPLTKAQQQEAYTKLS